MNLVGGRHSYRRSVYPDFVAVIDALERCWRRLRVLARIDRCFKGWDLLQSRIVRGPGKLDHRESLEDFP